MYSPFNAAACAQTPPNATPQALLSLSGKTAVVVGGGGHIGLAVAQSLAAVGARVVIADKSEEMSQKAAQAIEAKVEGSEAITFSLDVTDKEHIQTMPARLSEAGVDSISALVQCQGLTSNPGGGPVEGYVAPLEKQTMAAWEMASVVNVQSVFFVLQACLPLLEAAVAKGEGASVVNIGSIYGCVGPVPSLYEGTSMCVPVAYSASKGGLAQMGRALATELGPRGIRVNTVSPGGRMATESDIQGAVVFLVSGMSSYITGQDLCVDGGWTAW